MDRNPAHLLLRNSMANTDSPLGDLRIHDDSVVH